MPSKLTQEHVDELTEQAKNGDEATGIAIREPAALATVKEATGIGGEYDPSDFSIPYVTLVQASSDAVKQRKAPAGAFLSSEGEHADSIDFVPLHIQFTRDFYDKEGQKNICGSRDRVTGYPADAAYFAQHGLDLVQGEPLACKDCPFMDWAPAYKMACLKGYTVTGFNLDTESPFMFRVRGTAVNVFRNRLVGAVAMRGKKPWERQMQMTSALKTRNGNSWFTPELEPTKTFSKDEQAEWERYAGGIVAPARQEAVEDAADDLPFE